MTADEIEEKLRGLSPAHLLGVIEELLRGDALTNGERRDFLELRPKLKEEAKQQEEVVKQLLLEKGTKVLEQIQQLLKYDNLTSEDRKNLENAAASIAGYQMSFWLPTTLGRKVLMFLFLAVGVIGVFLWSPWFGLFILLGCSFSPRIAGEVLHLGANFGIKPYSNFGIKAYSKLL